MPFRQQVREEDRQAGRRRARWHIGRTSCRLFSQSAG
jgi:hypothetical protein